MSHDPEMSASAYVSGVMRARKARRFEDHLVECEDCFREVRVAQLGRNVAESARELAPPSLRETVRAAIAASPAPPRRARWWLGGGIGAATAAAVLAFALVASPSQPRAIAVAVEDYRLGRAPAEMLGHTASPIPASSGLTLASASAGLLEGHRVESFTYTDALGHRLVLYLSDDPFPVAHGARRMVPDGPWRATVDGIELLCSSEPHALLALSDSAEMLGAVVETMGVRGVPL